QRRVAPEAIDEELFQDERPLRVDRAAELGLALDVDDLAAAGADARGDVRGYAERIAAEVDHGEPVGLADDGPAGLDVHAPEYDVLAHAQLEEALALGARVEGGLDVVALDGLGPVARREEARLAHEVGDPAEARRELVLVVRD